MNIKRYFNILNKREQMFVRFRHYAVMAVAYKRSKDYFNDNKCYKNGINITIKFLRKLLNIK